MKKLITYLSILSCCAFFSCDNMNDIHQEYLESGERVYLGIASNPESFSGNRRVKIRWTQNADPRIEETVILWNQGKDSIVRPFVRINDGIQKDSVILDDLEEGTYQFKLINRNSKGERSLGSEVQGTAYGATYISGLRSRDVSSLNVVSFDSNTKSATVRINWATAVASGSGTIVRYKKFTTGEEVELTVGSAETQTVLTDVGNRLNNDDDMIWLSSLYRPDKSIDTFRSEEFKTQIVSFLASGKRMEYTVAGVAGAVTSFSNLEKYVWIPLAVRDRVTVYDCNRFGNFGAYTDFTLNQFRLNMSEDNTALISGFSYANSSTLSYTIVSTDKVSSFDPASGKLVLNYKRIIASTGNSTVVEEQLIPR
ncbi:MAG: DUF4998 domain-containing protein [Mangrovibacterium sp.]|nr:DUF4998 domain-containing protein [Mangrovibacterium sp.]